MQRAARRSEQNRKDLMWKKLAGKDKPNTGYRGAAEWDAGYYYAPYIPVMRDGSVGIIMTGITA